MAIFRAKNKEKLINILKPLRTSIPSSQFSASTTKMLWEAAATILIVTLIGFNAIMAFMLLSQKPIPLQQNGAVGRIGE